jgi:chromosome segregation ATPase
MYQLKSAEKQLKKQETDNANQIEELEGTNNELQALLDDYETDIDSFNNKISQKDELIDDLNSKLEVLKEQAESFNLDQKQKLETQAVQN